MNYRHLKQFIFLFAWAWRLTAKMSVEITSAFSASKGFRGLSYLLSRSNEPIFYTVIRLVVTCVSETWVRAKKDEAICLFESRILRCIFGAVKEIVKCTRRYNSEIYKLYNEIDLVKYIRTHILL